MDAGAIAENNEIANFLPSYQHVFPASVQIAQLSVWYKNVTYNFSSGFIKSKKAIIRDDTALFL